MESYLDWKIHKKLKEEQERQRFARMMLLMGRGNGKTSSLLKEIEDYIAVTNKPEPFKLTKKDVERVRETILDYDICSNRTWSMYDYTTKWCWEPKLYYDPGIESDFRNEYYKWQLHFYNLLFREDK